MTELWQTLEDEPRILVVAGRSAIDPDCLVARVKDGDGAVLWIVEGSKPDCYVTGLGCRAKRLWP